MSAAAWALVGASGIVAVLAVRALRVARARLARTQLELLAALYRGGAAQAEATRMRAFAEDQIETRAADVARFRAEFQELRQLQDHYLRELHALAATGTIPPGAPGSVH